MRPHVVDEVGGHPEGDSAFGASVGSRRAETGDAHGWRVGNEGRMHQTWPEQCRKNWNFRVFIFRE